MNQEATLPKNEGGNKVKQVIIVLVGGLLLAIFIISGMKEFSIAMMKKAKVWQSLPYELSILHRIALLSACFIRHNFLILTLIILAIWIGAVLTVAIRAERSKK
ncbi:MAG: hypothetical protein DRN95_08120 [Candidatus Hydrothermarchaeota archaeon]|nr:MAG: hypothetical protein DRN95_08120 [Candidatus Hydrothermarchaeota archaeon]